MIEALRQAAEMAPEPAARLSAAAHVTDVGQHAHCRHGSHGPGATRSSTSPTTTGLASVEELSSTFGVTASTIRRDLA